MAASTALKFIVIFVERFRFRYRGVYSVVIRFCNRRVGDGFFDSEGIYYAHIGYTISRYAKRIVGNCYLGNVRGILLILNRGEREGFVQDIVVF